tara:strand:+ start:106 stop:1362 length:1257 start_codon:yes stop_codon:yes gene_type:complete
MINTRLIKGKFTLSALLFVLLCFIVFCDIIRYTMMHDFYIVPYPTIFSLFFVYTSILILIFSFFVLKKKLQINKTTLVFFYLWLFINIVNIVRALFVSDGYWDYKFLFQTSIPFTFISMSFYLGNNLIFFKRIIVFFCKYFLVLGFLLIPLGFISDEQLYCRIMIPIYFIILLIPFLKLKWRVLILFVSITSILISLDFRMNIIRIIISFLIMLTYYIRYLIPKSIINFINILFFVIPFLLLSAAIYLDYNFFENLKNQDVTYYNNEGIAINLGNDTRTFLYLEVFNSLEKNNSLIFGEGSSGKYESFWFYNTGGAIGGERYRTEVNILNILTYFGIVGVISYLLILFNITYRSIHYSNNYLCKMFGLLVASRWTLSFVEEYSQMDLNFFFFWLVTGMISNKVLQKYSNKEIKQYISF